MRGIAAGTVEVFIPENSITRTNGNPALVISVFKTGSANTVIVANETDEVLLKKYADDPELDYQVVFEQATFIEDAISGVFGEAINGGIFAILVILLFLSGRVRGRYRLSFARRVHRWSLDPGLDSHRGAAHALAAVADRRAP